MVCASQTLEGVINKRQPAGAAFFVPMSTGTDVAGAEVKASAGRVAPSPACGGAKDSAAVAQACEILDAALGEPEFWQHFMRQDEVAAWLRKSLKAKAQRDLAFARYVVGSQPAGSPTGSPTAAATRSPVPAFTPSLAFTQRVAAVNTPSRSVCSRRAPEKGVEGNDDCEILGVSIVQVKGSSKAHPSAAKVAKDGAGIARSSPAIPGKPAVRRSLLDAFGDLPSSETPARKCAKTGRSRMPKLTPSSAALDSSMGEQGAAFLPLPTPVAATVASFLSFSETARLAVVGRGAQDVLSHPSSWENVVMNKKESGAFLRHLRASDALALLPPAQLPVPQALWQAQELTIEMMEADEPPPEGMDEEKEASVSASPSAKELCYPVLDPLEELSRRLRKGCFSAAKKITLSNIEDHRLDYHFLALRGTCFASFPQVRVTSNGSRYTLTACREPLACTSAPELTDPAAAMTKSVARQPREAPLLMEPPAPFTAAEALFLLEHKQAFKSGDRFHFVHAPWRSCDGKEVRKRYEVVLKMVQNRQSCPMIA